MKIGPPVRPYLWWTDQKRKLGICWDHPRHGIKIKFLHGGWSQGDSCKVQILLKSVRRFPRCGEIKKICPLSLHWPLAYTTAYKPWCNALQIVHSSTKLFLFHGVVCSHLSCWGKSGWNRQLSSEDMQVSTLCKFGENADSRPFWR